ncbi:class IV lanthionine synthetase LanL [Microtetraspora glauca]|uniref:non-specific serine/threonine protein kinase n=1 Tax=Microtetraspora glauca TaxID=1996 RepID=A0ABV3GEL4_MICGL
MDIEVRGPDESSDAWRDSDETLLVDCARAVLNRREARDWQVELGDFWCYVQPPGGRSRVQGWKLHVSATPLSAPLVLARCADVLVRHRTPFKFARNLDKVHRLVSDRCDRGAGGKFITVYPNDDDDRLRALAEDLHRATEGLPGPGILSDRPYRPGSLVQYRFGVFGGVRMLGNDGSYEAMLVAPDGSLRLDRRDAWFSPPSWAPRDPFTRERSSPQPGANGTGPRQVLLNGRYVVREVIRHAFGGGVYRATDEHTGGTVVIKQARPHTAADVTGKDIRDARRHEARTLELFETSGVTTRLVELFEQQGDLFLVQEAVQGVTLRQWVTENIEPDDGAGWGPSSDTAERIARGLVELVESVHAKGLVHRDFNPNNIMVTEDGDLRLIDLETLAGTGERVTQAYTPGYAAPEQVDGPRICTPQPATDLYSLGATLFYLVSGVDPLLAPDEPQTRTYEERIDIWLRRFAAGNAAARRMAGIIVPLLHPDPARRPSLESVRAFLARPERPHADDRDDAPPARPVDVDQMIVHATERLLLTMEPDNPNRLWKSPGFGETCDPLNIQYGAAGVLGVLTRVYETRQDPAMRDAVATVASWISRHVTREPRSLPGLHFGRSGTAWALLEAGLALGDEDVVRLAADLALRVPVDWPNPDVCHGVAGAGFTQLRFWEVTKEDEFLDRARQAARALTAAAENRNGLTVWPIARDFASALAGVTHYGFAHGVAGVGAFLLAAARATGDVGCLDLAVRAAGTLLSVAEVKGGAAYWPSGEGEDGPLMTHWCSGSSGVGTFLVRLWRQTGDDRLRAAASRAAVAIHRSRWHAGISQCHGLAGDGEFLIDLADACQDERYRDWAEDLAVNIHLRTVLRDGLLVPPDETGELDLAGFNTGLAGVLAFLVRLRHGGSRLWLPESPMNLLPEARPGTGATRRR